MKITNQWLKKHDACTDGYKWATKQKERELKPFIYTLMSTDHFDWANWVIVRCLTRKQKIMYAIFAAEQVIDIFEKKNPDDKRPRQAIDAAKDVLKNNNEKTGAAAWAAVAAGDAAVAAAGAARDAAWAAAWAAGDAARDAAWAAGDAAWAAARAAGDAARAAAKKEMQIKIINYGLYLVKPEDVEEVQA